ncbi:Hypothetical protein POVR1_LOCUS561 [uncultured virus]|nr:Hypothetical protein POVR1_LOCUS561 [uncultured virus]
MDTLSILQLIIEREDLLWNLLLHIEDLVDLATFPDRRAMMILQDPRFWKSKLERLHPLAHKNLSEHSMINYREAYLGIKRFGYHLGLLKELVGSGPDTFTSEVICKSLIKSHLSATEALYFLRDGEPTIHLSFYRHVVACLIDKVLESNEFDNRQALKMMLKVGTDVDIRLQTLQRLVRRVQDCSIIFNFPFSIRSETALRVMIPIYAMKDKILQVAFQVSSILDSADGNPEDFDRALGFGWYLKEYSDHLPQVIYPLFACLALSRYENILHLASLVNLVDVVTPPGYDFYTHALSDIVIKAESKILDYLLSQPDLKFHHYDFRMRLYIRYNLESGRLPERIRRDPRSHYNFHRKRFEVSKVLMRHEPSILVEELQKIIHATHFKDFYPVMLGVTSEDKVRIDELMVEWMKYLISDPTIVLPKELLEVENIPSGVCQLLANDPRLS